MGQVEHIMEAIKSAVRQTYLNALEDLALKEVEKNVLRRADLERLTARHPAPPEWLDEPE